MQNLSIFTCIETYYWCLQNNKSKNVYWKHAQGTHTNKIEKQNFTHKPHIHIQNNTPHPLSWLFFIFIFHELSTQPSIQHGSPTLSLSLKFLKSLWVVDNILNRYWIVIGALLEFSTLFNFAPFIFFLNILILMWISILASCPLKCSWYRMFRWYL